MGKCQYEAEYLHKAAAPSNEPHNLEVSLVGPCSPAPHYRPQQFDNQAATRQCPKQHLYAQTDSWQFQDRSDAPKWRTHQRLHQQPNEGGTHDEFARTRKTGKHAL